MRKSARNEFATHSVVNSFGVARIWLALAALAALLAAVPGTASADPPTRITIVAVFDPISFGENGYVNGQLFGVGQPGQLVGLEQAPPPFTAWAPVAQVTADAVGYYTFKLHPSQTMQYRTNSQGILSERVVQISVAPRLRFGARAAGKSSVRFSGTIAPALAGQLVDIQQRTASGWRTVGSARLRSGRTFAGRLRARRPAILRALYPTDGAHLTARSRPVTLRP